jgi:hypothetical protein
MTNGFTKQIILLILPHIKNLVHLPKIKAMKNLLYLIVVFSLLSSCQYRRGSGNIISENKSVGNFSEVEISSAFDVELKLGSSPSVVVECDDNLLKYVQVEKRGDKLVVRRKGNFNFTDAHFKVFITSPEIDKIDLSGASDMKLIGVLSNPDKLTIKTSGASSITGLVDAPEIVTDASGASDIDLKGRTRLYHAEASGSSDIKTSELKSESTDVRASGASNIAAHSSVAMKADASGASTIDCFGGGKIERQASGASNINDKN